jgi:hypothetical protein
LTDWCAADRTYEACCTGYTPPPTNTPTPSPTNTPTNTPIVTYNATIVLHFIESSSASLAGDVCTGPTTPLYTATTNLNWGSGNVQDPDGGTYSFTLTGVSEGDTFDLQSWPQDSNFGCSCAPSPIAGYENRCYYANITVPPQASPTLDVNVYFDQANHPESWFQTFGGSAFARNALTSIVPATTCEARTGECQPAVFVPKPGLIDDLSSGFPLLGTDLSSQLLTDENDSPSTRFQNIHWAGENQVCPNLFVLSNRFSHTS